MPTIPYKLPTSPFKRLIINNAVIGGTSISWELQSQFCDPGPYEFTVQQANDPASDNWEDVNNTPATDVYAIILDTVRRIYDSEFRSFYRVKLESEKGTYISDPAPVTGVWSKKDWLTARQIIKKERLRFQKYVGKYGYLWKKRIFGETCTDCTDFVTQEATNSNCSLCFSTGKKYGYYPPVAIYADMIQPVSLNSVSGKGMHNDMTATARMVAYPYMETEDIWVDVSSDRRYYVGAIQPIASIRGIPIVNQVELRLAPSTDKIYELDATDPYQGELSSSSSNSSSSLYIDPSLSTNSIWVSEQGNIPIWP